MPTTNQRFFHQGRFWPSPPPAPPFASGEEEGDDDDGCTAVLLLLVSAIGRALSGSSCCRGLLSVLKRQYGDWRGVGWSSTALGGSEDPSWRERGAAAVVIEAGDGVCGSSYLSPLALLIIISLSPSLSVFVFSSGWSRRERDHGIHTIREARCWWGRGRGKSSGKACQQKTSCSRPTVWFLSLDDAVPYPCRTQVQH